MCDVLVAHGCVGRHDAVVHLTFDFDGSLESVELDFDEV